MRRVRLDFNNFVSSNYDADKKVGGKSGSKNKEETAQYEPATSILQAVEALMNMAPYLEPDIILPLIHTYKYFEGVADLPKERLKINECLTNAQWGRTRT